jgi:hypothetical protein
MIKYTLLENAIDSIGYGINQLEQAVATDEKKYYKYSLLNLFQGTELLLKEILVQISPIIIFDKNSLYKKCIDPTNPKIEELYNCKSIDIFEICGELKKYYPTSFDSVALRLIENIAKERNKIQHFAIEIAPATIKENLILLYGKVIKPSFNILNDYLPSDVNLLGEKIEELYCLHTNADGEEAMLKISGEDFTRGCCHNCNNYSMFIFYDKDSYPNRFYCTSCPYERKDIHIGDFRECPECGVNSLIYDDNLMGGVCLWYKCANHGDGGIMIDMEFCKTCKDYAIEGVCECNREK